MNCSVPITKTKYTFTTKDGVKHNGVYDFNNLAQRRFFDENGKEYTSNDIQSWEEQA